MVKFFPMIRNFSIFCLSRQNDVTVMTDAIYCSVIDLTARNTCHRRGYQFARGIEGTLTVNECRRVCTVVKLSRTGNARSQTSSSGLRGLELTNNDGDNVYGTFPIM